jgi:hypothetical protein
MVAEQYALRFISGKDHGREVRLPRDRALVVGRTSEADLLILDDKVSRKHAKISTFGGKVVIEDMQSRNGVFVNGERVRRTELADGDEIQVGASTIRFVAFKNGAAATTPATRPLEATQELRTPLHGSSLTGSIADISLPDLLQLFVTAKKSGVLTLRSGHGAGRIHLREGHIYHVSVDAGIVLPPRKAFYRMLRWKNGTFALEPLNGHSAPEDITESTMTLLLQGIQQLDETRLLEDKLPAPNARLSVPMNIPGNLHDLATEEVQVFQLVLHHGTLKAVVDHFPGTDLEAYTCVLGLLRRGFIVIGDQR